MKLEEVDINRAHGLRLSEELLLNDKILKKNHVLTHDDIVLLKKMGRQTVFGAWAESGDVDFNTALGIAAAKICGQNLGYRVDERGFCEMVATQDGLFEVYPDRLNKFNRYSKYFVLNTTAPFQLVKQGDILARIEILTPIISQDIIDDLVTFLSGNTALLNVQELKKQRAAMLYTSFYNDDNENIHLTDSTAKLTDTYRPLNIAFTIEQTADHTMDEIAAALETLLKSSADIIFIIPGLRSYTDDDIMTKAISSIADEIVCPHIPQFGGTDLIIALKKNKKIIALPYNYAFIDTPLQENFIRLAIVKEKLQAFDFNRPETPLIGSIEQRNDLSDFIRGKARENTNKASIAAVILAAGQSKRLGKNKLLADIKDMPLALKAVRAAVASNASPVFVVTGFQAETLETELENLDVNIVYNPNYREGIKTSINIGLKSVPDFCDGALLLPADMPNVTPELINKMINAFDNQRDNQLVIAEKKGVKSNPILWSKSLYDKADLVAENADVRPIFVEHADYTTMIKASEKELLDVNFQHDLDVAQKSS